MFIAVARRVHTLVGMAVYTIYPGLPPTACWTNKAVRRAVTKLFTNSCMAVGYTTTGYFYCKRFLIFFFFLFRRTRFYKFFFFFSSICSSRNGISNGLNEHRIRVKNFICYGRTILDDDWLIRQTSCTFRSRIILLNLVCQFVSKLLKLLICLAFLKFICCYFFYSFENYK